MANKILVTVFLVSETKRFLIRKQQSAQPEAIINVTTIQPAEEESADPQNKNSVKIENRILKFVVKNYVCMFLTNTV